MIGLAPLKRALISVSDKSGLLDLAQALVVRDVQLLSTGGSAKAMRDVGLEVTDVESVTGFPEMMDGRVKTLHPNIHGGLRAVRDNQDHKESQEEYNIENIDLLIVNLYPFENIVNTGTKDEICVENICKPIRYFPI